MRGGRSGTEVGTRAGGSVRRRYDWTRSMRGCGGRGDHLSGRDEISSDVIDVP